MSCQMQDAPLVLSDNAASAGGGNSTVDPACYSNSYTFNSDGTELTLTIADAGCAKSISHMLFKFNGIAAGKTCAERPAADLQLTLANITSFTVNGSDAMASGYLGVTEGQGTSCYGIFTNPFIKLAKAPNVFPVVIKIGFDVQVTDGQFLIKAGTSCIGSSLSNYSVSRQCIDAPKCYKEDTGWAAGSRYVTRGNWATFTAYTAGSVNIYAGQNKFAGTATMSAVTNGNVTITMKLNDGWSLQEVSNPVKIQGYSTAPSGNPSPGRFASKGTSLTVTLPAANFYGIHLDVRQAVECPN